MIVLSDFYLLYYYENKVYTLLNKNIKFYMILIKIDKNIENIDIKMIHY
jgi:hypothetical protein